MRWDNDRRLAENVPEIDLFLGGHDHEYQVEKVEQVNLLHLRLINRLLIKG